MRTLRKYWRSLLWGTGVTRRWGRHLSIEPGVRTELYPDDRLSRLIYTDDFEWEERRFLSAFLRPADIFVDVGANIGLYTIVAGHLVGDQGRVYAFEPSARPFRRLIANVALNRLTNVECLQMALSDQAERMIMAVSQGGYDAWNSLGAPIAGSAFVEEPVECIRWDDFANDRGLLGCVTMMKIDVEGWERPVLLGAAEGLARDDAPVLQVEFTDAAARSAGSSCAALYRQLEGLGYRMYVYDPHARVLTPDPIRPIYPYMNLFAVKRLEQIEERLAQHVA